MSLLLACGWAFICAAFVTRWLHVDRRYATLLDHPNQRSLHTVPTPRGGGIAIAVAVVSAMFIAPGPYALLTPVAAAAGLLFAVSLLDDIKSQSAGLRLGAQGVAAALALSGGLVLERLTVPGMHLSLPIIAGVVLSGLFIVWMINLYNFMDGMDGFAGGMAVIGFACFGVLALRAQQPAFASVSFVLSAAAAGFVLYNFPPAKIFMGDSGSSMLGFAAGGLSLWADVAGIFPLWIAALVFSPFIVDASATLAARALRGERVWRAHKSHYYQRLVEVGWGHRKTVLCEYGLMVGCALSALVCGSLSVKAQWLLLTSWVIIYTLLMVYVKCLQRRVREHEHYSSA